jgi:hypothetical protein
MNFPGGIIFGFILVGALEAYRIFRRTSRVAIVHRIPLPTQPAKHLDSTLYPDLQGKGGLAAALQAVMTELGGHLTVDVCSTPGDVYYASVTSGKRSSGVFHSCGFSVGFWHQEVRYGGGWARELVDIGRAIVAFQVEKASVTEMAARFNWFVPEEYVYSHGQSADAYVDARWRELEGRLESDLNHPKERLLPLFLEAAKRPELRQLFPFTSVGFLCFSRKTAYPFSHDCPIAFCREAGFFIVMAIDQKTILGEGDAQQAADIIVANLPPNCGPATHGSADTLKL